MSAEGSTRPKVAGVFAPISTPFAPNEDVDLGALRVQPRAVRRERESAATSTLGSNGENRSLSEDERLRVLDRRRAHKRLRPGGHRRCRLRRAARGGAVPRGGGGPGADFGLVLSPGYFRAQMTDEVLYRYFTIAGRRRPDPPAPLQRAGLLRHHPQSGARRTPRGPSEHRGHEGQRVERNRAVPAPPGPDVPGAGGLGQLPLPGHAGGLARGHRLARQFVPRTSPSSCSATARARRRGDGLPFQDLGHAGQRGDLRRIRRGRRQGGHGPRRFRRGHPAAPAAPPRADPGRAPCSDILRAEGLLR